MVTEYEGIIHCYKSISIKYMLYTTDLNKAGHIGQNNFKDVIVKNEVRIQCNAKIFNGFCGYRIIPQQRQTDVREVGECLETSV